MNTTFRNVSVKVEPENNSKYQNLFHRFEYFTNYIDFAFEFLTPEIWVNSETEPTLAFLYTPPAYFLSGDPQPAEAAAIFERIPADSWIIPSSEKWYDLLTSFFGERLDVHPRTSFDASSLNLEHLRSLKTELPAGLRLVPIGAAQVNDQDGMLYQDLLERFFSSADFLQQGAGFCILDGEEVIGFAAANYPIRSNILEVYIRVGYNDHPEHRQKGLGTLLSVALLEYCLENNLEPQWDAANDISVRLALKLGYTLHKNWNMYHLN